MTIRQTASFQVRPEALEQCEQAIREFVAYVKEHEPGTLLYTSLQEREDPTRFLHSFLFQDEAARDTHRHSEAVKQFTDVLYPHTIVPVEFTEYTLVTSTKEAASEDR
jgi:quinol monooxygenase YgiN